MSNIQLRESVQWFAEQMEMKLRKYDDRGGWSDENPMWLLGRALDEIDELQRAFNKEDIDGSINREEIIKEAADVANFMHMIADNQRRK